MSRLMNLLYGDEISNIGDYNNDSNNNASSPHTYPLWNRTQKHVTSGIWMGFGGGSLLWKGI